MNTSAADASSRQSAVTSTPPTSSTADTGTVSPAAAASRGPAASSAAAGISSSTPATTPATALDDQQAQQVADEVLASGDPQAGLAKFAQTMTGMDADSQARAVGALMHQDPGASLALLRGSRVDELTAGQKIDAAGRQAVLNSFAAAYNRGHLSPPQALDFLGVDPGKAPGLQAKQFQRAMGLMSGSDGEMAQARQRMVNDGFKLAEYRDAHALPAWDHPAAFALTLAAQGGQLGDVAQSFKGLTSAGQRAVAQDLARAAPGYRNSARAVPGLGDPLNQLTRALGQAYPASTVEGQRLIGEVARGMAATQDPALMREAKALDPKVVELPAVAAAVGDAESIRASQTMAAALGGEFAVLDASLSPDIASGYAGPAGRVVDEPVGAVLGVGKSVYNNTVGAPTGLAIKGGAYLAAGDMLMSGAVLGIDTRDEAAELMRQGREGEQAVLAKPDSPGEQVGMAVGDAGFAMAGAAALWRSAAGLYNEGSLARTWGRVEQAAAVPKLAAQDVLRSREVDAVQVGWLGGKTYDPKKLEQLAKFLERRGVTLKVGDEHLPTPRASGAFATDGSELVLASNPTEYLVWHELSHFLQFKQIGKDAYMALPRSATYNAPEQFVFDMLENSPKRWNALTPEERQHAVDYILAVGGLR